MAGITVHRLADREMNEAAQFYETGSKGLGAMFLDEVERSLRSISDYPEASPIVRGSIRRRLLRRFPYGLLYSVKADGIRILAVMNLKRRPNYWVGRE